MAGGRCRMERRRLRRKDSGRSTTARLLMKPSGRLPRSVPSFPSISKQTKRPQGMNLHRTKTPRKAYNAEIYWSFRFGGHNGEYIHPTNIYTHSSKPVDNSPHNEYCHRRCCTTYGGSYVEQDYTSDEKQFIVEFAEEITPTWLSVVGSTQANSVQTGKD